MADRLKPQEPGRVESPTRGGDDDESVRNTVYEVERLRAEGEDCDIKGARRDSLSIAVSTYITSVRGATPEDEVDAMPAPDAEPDD